MLLAALVVFYACGPLLLKRGMWGNSHALRDILMLRLIDQPSDLAWQRLFLIHEHAMNCAVHDMIYHSLVRHMLQMCMRMAAMYPCYTCMRLRICACAMKWCQNQGVRGLAHGWGMRIDGLSVMSHLWLYAFMVIAL